MASTTFSDVTGTPIVAVWLNDANAATYLAASSMSGSPVSRKAITKFADTVHVKDYGAVGDGTTDDSAAIQAAITANRAVDFRGGSYKINTTITLPANRFLDLRGVDISANTGATPLFSFGSGNALLYILAGGGQVTGTASSFLFAQGTTNTPTLQAHYASQIHIEGLTVNSTTITTALVFDKAVKSVHLNGCNFFTPNGINASGKCVEIMVSNSIIYSATGVAGTVGIKLRSTGGTVYYNEGWQIINCTIDNFEINHDITDIFCYSVTGGYNGVNATLAATTGYTFQFQAPSTNLCQDINITGTIIGGRTRFATAGSGQAYQAKISSNIFNGVPGTAIALENNTAYVTINDCVFSGGTGTAVGVVGTNNNASIICTDLKFDTTYQNGVVLNGATGTDCLVGPLLGSTSGDLAGAGRSNIIYQGVPVHSTAVAALNRSFNAANLGGGATYAVAVAISTQAVTFGRGETGDIVVCLSYSGANAATQNVQIAVPAGMVLASGTGWSAGNLYLGAATGLLYARVPYYCTADGTGNVTVTNQAGNTLTINNQGYCGIIRNW